MKWKNGLVWMGSSAGLCSPSSLDPQFIAASFPPELLQLWLMRQDESQLQEEELGTTSCRKWNWACTCIVNHQFNAGARSCSLGLISALQANCLLNYGDFLEVHGWDFTFQHRGCRFQQSLIRTKIPHAFLQSKNQNIKIKKTEALLL